ncbi:FadR/GntR family transcriptional regulator [Paenibacillus eucommiae]|uniref:GntR family transcriptional repressor for pyruvate dehydrogenase complex n=1 Tax=Paenibacillus eucommiae TaxID=1355755 RepID=A0ABS4IP16_9BACL|nr:FadR/GntR family transcriptional regulator [Paenibacillus eucommiae]MBP1989303.1 GntR family transcriptional repressor for pyruvate dehydrogenase complex [Paenibacillus eucommiae]
MEIIKVASSKIYEQIAAQIRQQIISGKLLPGDKLPSTRELSESFQVGRSTVREALSALKAMGLVEIHQGEGIYVRKINPSDLEMPSLDALLMSRTTILELLEARKSLEVSNAGLAAEKRTEEDLLAFEDILVRMKNSLGDEEQGEKEDMLFHLTLARATHNSIMARLLETISAQMELAIRETRRLQMYSNKSVSLQLWKEHQEIFEAVQAGNSNVAQEKMKQHLFHVERVLLRYLK